jgi:hypothetical protein
MREQTAQAAAALRHAAAGVGVPATAASAAAAHTTAAETTAAAAKKGFRIARDGQNGHDQSNPMKVHFHNLHSRTRARR